MKSKGIYRETKDYDRYFILSINDDNIKKIKEVPLNYDTRDISPQNNLVLYIDYELKNTFGVITRISQKLIVKK